MKRQTYETVAGPAADVPADVDARLDAVMVRLNNVFWLMDRDNDHRGHSDLVNAQAYVLQAMKARGRPSAAQDRHGGGRAYDRADGCGEGPEGAVAGKLQPEPAAPGKHEEAFGARDPVPAPGAGIRRVWAKGPSDIAHRFVFCAKGYEAEVPELVERREFLHGLESPDGLELGPRPCVVTHVFADLEELDDQVCRDLVHKTLRSIYVADGQLLPLWPPARSEGR